MPELFEYPRLVEMEKHKVDALEAHNASLKERNASLTKHNANLKADNADMAKRIQELMDENERLRCGNESHPSKRSRSS